MAIDNIRDTEIRRKTHACTILHVLEHYNNIAKMITSYRQVPAWLHYATNPRNINFINLR